MAPGQVSTPCLYLPPQLSPRHLALPGVRASALGSESLGRVPTPPLVFWEIGKVTGFPFPYSSGWLPTSQACYFQKTAESIREAHCSPGLRRKECGAWSVLAVSTGLPGESGSRTSTLQLVWSDDLPLQQGWISSPDGCSSLARPGTFPL